MDEQNATLADSSFRIITALRWTKRHGDSNESNTSPTPSPSALDTDLLPLHRDRMLAAAEKFRWPKAVKMLEGQSGLALIWREIDLHFKHDHGRVSKGMQFYKVRILASQTGELTLESSEISQVSSEVLLQQSFIPTSLTMPAFIGNLASVYVDLQPTTPSVFTTHKTTIRTAYNSARQRLDISESSATEAEVLLWNADGEIMEASLCTPYFLRDGSWTTPSLLCGGNAGVSRRKALEAGLCQEGIIRVSSLRNAEDIWLSNAVRGFFPGRVHLNNQLDIGQQRHPL